ncbi:rod shape-determining protein [Streptomyces malaysiensis]|nr:MULTISPECIES: rod shape-determining protein [Streptomyces]MCQ6244449.1 rod shape-determining protein [Streptomyces malaysiensis]WPB93409.1 rod shape-determining protein [Streptomyces malaysiensis]
MPAPRRTGTPDDRSAGPLLRTVPAGAGGRAMTVIRRLRAGSRIRHRHRPWPLCRHCCGLALDMGSARTRAWIAGRGTIIDVPTITFPGAGAVHPIQRGAIVDVPGTARMLDRLLSRRLPRLTRPLVVVTAPVLDGPAYRERARTAVEVLRPRAVLTVPTARAIALAANADLSLPLLVVDIGAHLTEVVLLVDGIVFDARRTALGTTDLADAGATAEISEAITSMITSMLRQDRTSLTADALSRGALLAGGGALRPDLTRRLIGGLHAPLRAVPAPHTAAVRGAAKILQAAHAHPSAGGTSPPGPGPLSR